MTVTDSQYKVGELYQLVPPIYAMTEFNGFNCYELLSSSYEEFLWIKCNTPCLHLHLRNDADGDWLHFLGEDCNSNFVEFAYWFSGRTISNIQPWTYHEKT